MGNKTLNLSKDKVSVALAGNPNVGKSTVFNYLTGLNQHTGNWPGKTVVNKTGKFSYKDKTFDIVDLPGTYSLLSDSEEEKSARDYICFEKPDIVVIVLDSTCIERNLNLALQISEIHSNIIICLNLIDEAEKKGIFVSKEKLEKELLKPVIQISAAKKINMDLLKEEIYLRSFEDKKNNEISKIIHYKDEIENSLKNITDILPDNVSSYKRWVALRLLEGNSEICKTITDNFYLTENTDLKNVVEIEKNLLKEKNINVSDEIILGNYNKAKNISEKCVTFKKENHLKRDRTIDKFLTNKITGIPIMFIVFMFILWITVKGANYPSELLFSFFGKVENILYNICIEYNVPVFITGMLVFGMFRVLSWVVSVMLPPMAIFFPLFTILEDFGYLPRVAFNLDGCFKKCCTCGKQCLTMCMGLGCNAAGVIGARIINSPRERLIAILTNNFMPCNGRFPSLIAVSTMFFSSGIFLINGSLFTAFILMSVITFGVLVTFLISYILSKTFLKGVPSFFVLELPPYRTPQFTRVIVTSIFDRTLFVFLLAIMIAAPAGLIIWLLSNVYIYDKSILIYISNFLDPLGKFMGLDGIILTAFILGFPANEIVIPLIIMGYLKTGSIAEFSSLIELKNLLVENNWTITTALCFICFSLMHWPCSTTLLTIKKECGSIKYTLMAFFIPTICGITVCAIINFVSNILF